MKNNKKAMGFVLLTFAIALLMSLPVSASIVETNFHNYLEAYYSKRYSVEDVNMGGNTYKDALCFDSYNNVDAEADFNLEGHFKSMTFYLAHEDSTKTLNTRTVTIYADNALVYEHVVKNGDLPVTGNISLANVKQLKIVVSGSSSTFNTCIGGIRIVSDGFTRGDKLKPVPSNFLSNVTAYNSNRYTTKNQVNVCDKIWENALCFDSYNGVDANAYFNLEGNYKELSFCLGHISGKGGNNRTFTVYGDSDKVLYSTTVAYNQIILPVTINITGVHQLRMQVGGSSSTFDTVVCGANLVSNGIVRSVSLDQTALNFSNNNKSAYLKAKIVPADAFNQSLIWTSSNESVATVSSNGLVTGVGPGNCIITVKTVDGGYTASCKVNSTITASINPINTENKTSTAGTGNNTNANNTERKTSTITKKANTLKIKVSYKAYKRSKLTRTRKFSIGVSKAQGKVTYTLNKAAKKAKIKVTKKGLVKIPRKCKKGIYKIVVKAAGNKYYRAGKKTVKIKIR